MSKPKIFQWIEHALEVGLFASRWLLAPFYVGLVVSLVMLVVTFCREIAGAIPTLLTMDSEEVILLVLTLIDLSLGANLVLIVIFSGYENFVSKIDTGDSADRPSWMGTLDFSGMKMKLIGSIVAISAISLLRAFMPLAAGHSEGKLEVVPDDNHLMWMVVLHLTFLASGVMFALMDWIAAKTEANNERLAERREMEAHAASRTHQPI